MTDDITDRNRESRWWAAKLWPIVAGVSIPLFAALIITTTGTIYTGDKTNALLTDRVQALLDENKDQRKLLQDILIKTGDLYTRREAQADREAAERRFQSLEGRIGDLGRRIEIVEANQRFMQQFVIDKPPGTRRP